MSPSNRILSTSLVLSLAILSPLSTFGFKPPLLTHNHIKRQSFLPSSILSNALPCSSSSSTSLFSSPSATLPEGLTKTVKKKGRGPPLSVGDVATVRYSCYLPNEPGTPFAKSDAQKFVIGDSLMVDGWELGLQSMYGGERSVIRVTNPKFGYGAVGVPPFVPENAEIEMDLEVINVEAGVDLGTIASADPLKPRTPASIAAAYNTRREIAAIEEAEQNLEGIDALIAKFKTFYFFGFFEGETGEEAPWYLKPSITFPIAFAVVGAAFAVSVLSGAITERGAQVTDELDEIKIASAAIQQGIVIASTMFSTMP
eukprot:CAMPEP_0195527488 /NCGR_PEP_ID=MMETSP0794_2-20130614/29193_1 /TAXON_ID=515487 /ORGANISM="Stephanopyxis turris, Strain CCMP 815" /LENGTH=312 /DNA_ID=CAMNT_0040658397 /DNA_START=106 /DNA_END=1044 /DNA_ORIENTATION=-